MEQSVAKLLPLLDVFFGQLSIENTQENFEKMGRLRIDIQSVLTKVSQFLSQSKASDALTLTFGRWNLSMAKFLGAMESLESKELLHQLHH